MSTLRFYSKRSYQVFTYVDAAKCVEDLNYWRESYGKWRAILADANREKDNKRKASAMVGLNKARAQLKAYIGAVELHLGFTGELREVA